MNAFLRTLALLVMAIFFAPAALYLVGRPKFALASCLILVLAVCVYFVFAAGLGLILWFLQVILAVMLIVVGLIKSRGNVS